MDVAPGDEIAELVAMAETQLAEMRQSGAMRSDPYRTALGVMTAVTQLQAAVARKMQPHGLTLDERLRFKADLIRAAGHDGRLLGQELNRRNVMWMASSIGGAFVLGVALALGAVYAASPSYEPIKLAGDAMLCRASGVRSDPAGVRYYPELTVKPEPVARQ